MNKPSHPLRRALARRIARAITPAELANWIVHDDTVSETASLEPDDELMEAVMWEYIDTQEGS